MSSGTCLRRKRQNSCIRRRFACCGWCGWKTPRQASGGATFSAVGAGFWRGKDGERACDDRAGSPADDEQDRRRAREEETCATGGDEADRRTVRVSATPKGEKLMQAGKARRVKALATRFELLSAAELKTLHEAAQLMLKL